MSVAQSVTRRLSLITLLTSGSILLIGSGTLVAMDIRPGPFVLMIAASTIISTCATWFAAKRLLSSPMLDLAETVRQISAAQDYSLRVTKRTEDEVGVLYDNVNELLGRMEERDQHYRGEGDRLEAEVEARTRELRESNERQEEAIAQAVAANNAKNQFIANLTHEIRTPMNGVLGMTELLSNTNLTPRQHKFTRTILESAEDLLSIINEILDFAKVEAGKLERVDNKPFSPRVCVEKVSELLKGRAKLKGLDLATECADDVPDAMLGDGKRLRQILTNLVGNALKFTEHGQIVMRTTLVEQSGEFRTIRFEVVDTGIGIPSHLHEHVFEGFSQADNSTTRQIGGAGLGLTISKHLVGLMGGKIGVISRSGVGSNFWFTVGGEVCRPPTAAGRDLDGVCALIVATAGESRDRLRHLLTTCGGIGVVVPGVERAHAALQTETFDVALIDAQGLDALALANEIRANEATKSLPLVLVSTVERSQEKLKEAGIDGWLPNPCSQTELFASIAKVTGRSNVSLSRADQAALESDDAEVGRRVESDVPQLQEAGAGVRVLLAEDHAVNREVATTMLETLKCRVDVAVDGAEAIEAAQQRHYDLIFLDCQMPRVDGYEAARQIRRLEQQNQEKGAEGATIDSGHLPIVALTAHTAPADRARSLESGMDDFVTKPFTLQTLGEVLVKWAAGRVESPAVSSLPTHTQPGSASTDDGPISEAALEQIFELDRLNGGGVFARFAGTFLATVPITLDTLRKAVREGDAAGVAVAAHGLKGVTLSVGAEAMAAVSQELEELGRTGTNEGLASLADKLDELYLAVKDALEARLEKERRDDVVSV